MTNLPLSSEDFTNLRADAESMFLDECALAPRVTVKDGAGEEIPEKQEHRAWGSPIRCSFDVRPGSKAFGPDHTLLAYDAGIRMAAGTAIDVHGWVKVVSRYGSAVDDGIVYEIMGPVQDGPSAIRLLLKRVEP